MTQPSDATPPTPDAYGDETGDASNGTQGLASQKNSVAKNRFISPLTRRILAVNVLALAILAAGALFHGEYRNNLIEREVASLRTHAEIFSVALSESAVQKLDRTIMADMATHIVQRLALSAKTRARLFRADSGELVADSRILLRPGGDIQREVLPPPGNVDAQPLLPTGDALDLWFARLLAWLPGHQVFPPYIETADPHADQFAEVQGAMRGETWSALRSLPDGRLMLSIAVPVKRYKQVLGVLLLSKDSREIDRALATVRLNIIEAFLISLAITTALSLYLAGTIARPVRILAQAAERIRHGHHRQHVIPEFKERSDEIGELAVALKEMTEALWTRMDAIERFAADVAHEIKNPLTSLRSAVETVARIKDPQKQQQLMDIISDDVSRLDRLISDISDASRLDAEMSRAEAEPLDLSATLEMLENLYTATRNAHTPSLTLEAEPNLTVEGVKDRLIQVMHNLIANAQSFSPRDGTITIRAKHDGATVVIDIEDQGPGIPQGKERTIFKRFYSERPSDEKFGTHSGLGLAISAQIIAAHHGTITASNLRDAGGNVKGAQFTIRLPAIRK